MKVSMMLSSAAVLALAAGSCLAADYYVAPSGNDNNPGTEAKPWKTISQANKTLQPGDTVYLRAGTYDGQSIQPAHSGTSESARIAYVAYPGEKPVIRRTKVGLNLVGRNYITVDGIGMDGEIVRGKYKKWPGVGGGSSNIENFAMIQNSNYNVIRNVTWRKAHGWAGIKILNKSHHNKILNSRFDFVGTYDNGQKDDPGDIIQIKESAEHNLVQGCTLTHGGHNLLEMSGRYNVIRNNIFDNDWSDYLGGNKGNRALSLKGEGPKNYTGGYNLFEGNVITNAKPASDNPAPPAMKVIGEGHIVRYNYLYNNSDNAIVTANGGGASNGYVSKNRIFHNIFYNNGGAAWNIMWNEKTGATMDDNIFKNNIVYNKRSPSGSELSVNMGKKSNPLRNNRFVGNLIAKDASGEVTANVKGIGTKSIAWYGNNYRSNFSANIVDVPQFVTNSPVTVEDFQPSSTSPVIDAGQHLTRTTSGGSGTVIAVDDAGYFTNGFGVVQGDMIQVGINAPVRVVAVDYAGNQVTVEQPLLWNSADPVSLPYTGTSPDIGPFEYGSALQPPGTPAGLSMEVNE